MRFSELSFGQLDSGYVVQARHSDYYAWETRTDPIQDLDYAKSIHLEIKEIHYPCETRLIKVTYEIIEETSND